MCGPNHAIPISDNQLEPIISRMRLIDVVLAKDRNFLAKKSDLQPMYKQNAQR